MRMLLPWLAIALSISACAPAASVPTRPMLYVHRLHPPAFLQLDETWRPVREIPFVPPQGCDLGSVHAPARGHDLALEMNCPFGPAVLLLDTHTGIARQLVTDSDSHFLAWAADGQSIYLRTNSINRPQIMRLGLKGETYTLPVNELTYVLAPAPAPAVEQLLYAFSQGMGAGSEMWLARSDGSLTRRLAADPGNYLALARWSPDGRRIAFIRIPDSATPFTLGELWVMQADGGDARKLASADAGHGFAPAWSPDGSRIAFVARDNAADPAADVSSDALVSDLHLVDLSGEAAIPITNLHGARVEAPVWKPDADVILFDARLDDKMHVYVLDLTAGTLQPIPIELICCAAWLRE